MLVSLSLQNLATISDTFLKFSVGLNVLTGETGAGKSILIDGLLLALGERADTSLVRPGEKLASVEAAFLNRDGSEFLLRREVRAGGRSRIFINDELATLNDVRKKINGVIDLHSQHSTPALLVRKVQSASLDEFGESSSMAGDLFRLFEEYRLLLHRLGELQNNHADNQETRNLVQHELALIEKLKPSREDHQSLIDERKNLQAARSSVEVIHGIVEGISGDNGILASLRNFQVKLERTGMETGEIVELIDQAEIALAETESSCSKTLSRINNTPWRLQEIDDRLDDYADLLDRCGGSLDRFLQRWEILGEQLKQFDLLERELAELEVTIPEKSIRLYESAEKLSIKRREASKKLQEAAQKELRLLGMPDGIFQVVMHEPSESRSLMIRGRNICSDGFEIPEFYFSANRGMEPGPLSSVASGGEISRVSLVLKLALASVTQAPTMIFDEIDSGIGGRTANLLADSLSRASETRQVLVITHLAQIASKAERHLAVSKEILDDLPATCVCILNSRQNRIEELSRLLGGGDAAKEHAGKMLDELIIGSAEDGDVY